MLSNTQLLIFELGRACNLADLHAKCPSALPLRFAGLDTAHQLDDEIIVSSAVEAYRQYGFTGMVGWHYYNEPTLQGERMLRMMDQIQAIAPARFILWSNGTRLEFILRHRERFAYVHCSPYVNDPLGLQLDNRLACPPRREGYQSADGPCCRPFTELIFDCFGNQHPCCADWQGKASLGNLREGFTVILERWAKFQDAVCGKWMRNDAPSACRECGSPFRNCSISDFDEGAKLRAERWRQAWN